MGNQEESQRGRGLNQEDQIISSIVGKQGIRRNIFEIERKMKEIHQNGTRSQML